MPFGVLSATIGSTRDGAGVKKKVINTTEVKKAFPGNTPLKVLKEKDITGRGNSLYRKEHI